MTQPAEPTTTERYSPCWRHLELARGQRDAFNRTWSQYLASDPYQFHVTTYPNGTGVFTIDTEYPEETARALSDAVLRLADHVQAAFDEAVRITTDTLAGTAHTDGDIGTVTRVRFPLTTSVAEFDHAIAAGALDGLRPDQVRHIDALQPHHRDDEGVHTGRQIMLTSLGFLHDIRAAGNRLRVGSWVQSASPELFTDPPGHVAAVVAEPPGFLGPSTVVARYRLRPERPGSVSVSGNPNIAIDPFIDPGPPPVDDDDTLSERFRRLFIGAAEVVRSLQQSMGDLRDMPVRPDAAADPRLSIGPPISEWAALGDTDLSLTPRELTSLSRSPLGMATVVDADQPTLVVKTPAGVFQRRLRPPLPLPADLTQGAAAEWIAQSVAGAWGLPDFVFQPRRVAKGAAFRELGDGTILVGDIGLALQSKSRDAEPRDEQRERSWLAKCTTKAAGQAAGTVRSLRREPADLVNGRGRTLVVDGNAYEWVRVVLIDHPDVPANVFPPAFEGDLPTVTLLRRDWEFLFDQLRSVLAVAQYLRRAAADNNSVAIGNEALRYYEYAHLDEESISAPAPPVLPGLGAQPFSLPTLPKAPAGSDDRAAHGLYRIILDDVATTAVASDVEEPDRLWILSELDHLAVASRTSLGRHLLAMLQQFSTPTEHLVVHHRRVLFSEGRQLAYSVASRFDETVRSTFTNWVQLRHHEMQEESEIVEDSVTIGVLLTPRYDGPRRWDTTMAAVRGDLDLDPTEIARWTRFFTASRLGVTNGSSTPTTVGEEEGAVRER